MNKKTLTLSEFLSHRFLPYRYILPIVIAFITAMIAGYALLNFYSINDTTFLKAISSHLSILLETQDGPELQRFTSSLAKEKGVNLKIIRNGEIIVSTDDSSMIGQRSIMDGHQFIGIDSMISKNNLLSAYKIKRPNGPDELNAQVIMETPLSNVAVMALSIGLVVFVLNFAILNLFALKIINTAQSSIEPIQELEQEIYRLHTFNDLNPQKQFKIRELENIFNAILTTNNKLQRSNEKLAESKARALTISAYKKLIHDLHTPIAALKQMIKIINKENVSDEKKEFAKNRVAEIAEQILFQIKSSKGNLKIEVTPKNQSLYESVQKATGQAQMAMVEYESIEVIEKYENDINEVSHDNMMLGRAISNLVVNAIESAKSMVEIAINRIGKEISITISDDGKGIETEMVSLYLQGRGKSTKKNGLGLGLASANHIIRLHQGKLIYRDSHLGGACFDIRLQG